MTEADILAIIESDTEMMRLLRAAESLGLPQWMIGAGFVRNKVWNHLHGLESVGNAGSDIDLIYFDAAHTDWEADVALSKRISEETGALWEIKNQAYMHGHNQFPPFTSAEDGLRHWVETATTVSVRLQGGKLEIIAPYGIADLVDLVIRPTPYFEKAPELAKERAARKGWFEKWPKLRFEEA